MKKFLAALAVVAACSLTMANAPKIPRSTAQGVQIEPAVVNPCGDEFSTAVKADILGKLQESKPSVVLDAVLGDDIQILQMRGYCAALDEPIGGEPRGDEVTPASVAKGLVADLKREAEANGYSVTFTSKLDKILGGNRLIVIVTPSAEKIKQSGLDFRVVQVFVFNNTRIVGVQLFTTPTGLKQP